MIKRSDFGKGQYLMLQNVSGIRSIYDTASREDLDISECKYGTMGNFAEEGMVALFDLDAEIIKQEGKFRLTDMFRDWEMQMQANHDYVTGKKQAYSPPPGFSCHEAGRSIDYDTKLIDETLDPPGGGKKGFELFWEISRDLGFTGVRINRRRPDIHATEAWHIDYMGIFTAVYERQGYKIMAQTAIMDAIGDNYPGFTPEYIKNARIQGYLLGLGLYKYNVDGKWGRGSERALKAYLGGKVEKNQYFDKVLKHYNIPKSK